MRRRRELALRKLVIDVGDGASIYLRVGTRCIEPTISDLRSFLGGAWSKRNVVVHQTRSLSPAEAAAFVAQTRTMLEALFAHIVVYEQRLQTDRQKLEFSPARTVPLRFFARWRDSKGDAYSDMMPTESSKFERPEDAVKALLAAGYIQHDGGDRSHRRSYRLTEAGTVYSAWS